MTTIGEALNILENLHYTVDGWDSLTRFLYFLNAMSLSFADRNAYTGDADWVNVPIAGLLDKQYALERSRLVNTSVGIYNAPPGKPPGASEPDFSIPEEGMHTTSFSIIDNWGNMLVCTSTIQDECGSGYVVPGRGFILNNELTDFSLSGNNQIVGGIKKRRTALPPLDNTMVGKRPRSSMSPTIIFKDGVPIYGLGSPNGVRIISAVAQVILNIIDWGMDIQTAVDLPRVHTANDNIWMVESGLTKYISQFSPTYVPYVNVIPIGVVAIVENKDGIYNAASDLRRPGSLAVSF